MPRVKGSGTMGVVRSLRLPRSLDAWFEARLREHPERSASELLLALFHGGLRLQDGYMERHRAYLERHADAGDVRAYAAYRQALADTFGEAYAAHVEAWIRHERGR